LYNLAGGNTTMEDATDAALDNIAGGNATTEDAMDAAQCWNSESILVYGGEGHEPINIAPYLVDEEDV
jgi:hypothetical protein